MTSSNDNATYIRQLNAAYIRQLTQNLHLYGIDAARQQLAADTYDSNLSPRQVEAIFREAKVVYDRECRVRRKFEADKTRAKNAKRNAKKRAARRRIRSKQLEQEAADLRQVVAQKIKKGDQHTPVGREEMETMEAKAAALVARAAAMRAAAEA